MSFAPRVLSRAAPRCLTGTRNCGRIAAQRTTRAVSSTSRVGRAVSSSATAARAPSRNLKSIAAPHGHHSVLRQIFDRSGQAAKQHRAYRVVRSRWEEEKKNDDKAAEEAPTAESAAEHAEVDESKKLADQVAEQEKEIKELKDQALRLVADMENVRRRAREDVEKANKFAVQKFAKELIDVADDMDRVIEHFPPEAKNEDSGPLHTMAEGITMVSKNLAKALARFGVEKFESLGQKFDPNLHDGLYQFEDPTKEPGTVGQVMKEGYMIKDRVLRPANVGTVKGPAKK